MASICHNFTKTRATQAKMRQKVEMVTLFYSNSRGSSPVQRTKNNLFCP